MSNGRIRSYVLRGGRATKLQQRSLSTLAPRYCIPYRQKTLELESLFVPPDQTIAPAYFVEIGFGMGLTTAQIAQDNRDKCYIGVEVFEAGVGKLLSEIQQRNLTNLLIIKADAVDVFTNMIRQGTLSGIHIFFPDPWPKKRHHKRRLVNPDFCRLIAGSLKTDGYVYFATDWEDYAINMVEAVDAVTVLRNPNRDLSKPGFSPQSSWRPVTKFEKKGIAKNHRIFEILAFRE